MFGVFVVGTDTEVGKTTFSALFARHLLAIGRTVAPFKPVESGCERDATGGLVPADASRLMAAVECQLDIDAVCPYRFEPPVTPWVAAREVGTEIELAQITERYRWLQDRFDWVVVEGCGGLLSPICEGFDTLDLISELALPTVVIGRSALGTINHTLMTLSTIRRSGHEPLGVVLSRARKEWELSEETNTEAIARFGDAQILGVIPHVLEGEMPRLDWMDDLVRQVEGT